MTYYFIPKAFFNNDLNQFFFLVNFLLVLLIIGLIMIAQTAVSTLEKFILQIIMLIMPSDLNMKPIIEKNLRAHGSRNLKTSLMFTLTLSFLVFTTANFKQIHFFVISLTKMITGSDLVITKIIYEGGNESVLEEYKLRDFLDENRVERGGIIESYTFQTMQLENLMNLKGFNKITAILSHPGQVGSSIKTKIYSLDSNAFESLDNEYFYPQEYIDDPLHTGKPY